MYSLIKNDFYTFLNRSLLYTLIEDFIYGDNYRTSKMTLYRNDLSFIKDSIYSWSIYRPRNKELL